MDLNVKDDLAFDACLNRIAIVSVNLFLIADLKFSFPLFYVASTDVSCSQEIIF